MSEKNEAHKEFTIIERVNKKYFTEIESSVLHFQQTLFDLQNECYKSWKNAVKANVSLQKEFAEKSGYNFELPKTTQTILEILNYSPQIFLVWNNLNHYLKEELYRFQAITLFTKLIL